MMETSGKNVLYHYLVVETDYIKKNQIVVCNSKVLSSALPLLTDASHDTR